MTYAMSDIHGEYEKYAEMLKKIEFSDDDTLYILGDVVDRGERPIDVLLDMMGRANVFPIIGNHELMAIELLRGLMVEITEENASTQIDGTFLGNLVHWQMNGGDTTMREIKKLPADEREYVLEYLEEFVPYEFVEVGARKFLLVHSGLGNFSPDKSIDDYSLGELTGTRPDYNKKYFKDDDVFIVCGHTPTLAITGKPLIYKKQNNICIDCGATFDGKLACLCLDTMEEFYV